MSSEANSDGGLPKSGPLLILSGPSGVGKTTVLRRLMEISNLPLKQSVSATTRPPRSDEISGRDYHFMSPADFASAVASGGFLEHAEVHGHRYGTLKREVEGWRSKGFGVVLVIDVQGAAQVRGRAPVDCSVFLTAPEADLRERLNRRGTDPVEVIERRLANARREIDRSGEYTKVLENTNLDRVVSELEGVWKPLFAR